MSASESNYQGTVINLEDSVDFKETHPTGCYEAELLEVTLQDLETTRNGERSTYIMSKWRMITPLGMEVDTGVPIWSDGRNNLIRKPLIAFGVDVTSNLVIGQNFKFADLYGRRCIITVNHEEVTSKTTGKPFMVHRVDRMVALNDAGAKYMSPYRFGGTPPPISPPSANHSAAASSAGSRPVSAAAPDSNWDRSDDDIPF